MPQTSAWYSKREGTEVYHNNSLCTEVNNIEAYNVKEGTGGKRLCHHCERLSRQEAIRPIGLGLLGGARTTSIVEAYFKAQQEKKGK